MNEVLTKLNVWGCDVDGALERFLDDKEMYVKFLNEVATDENLDKLGEAISATEVKDAFECAHTLKGVHGNMGLTPLYELDQEMVESLRAGKLDGVELQYKALMQENEALKAILNK